jgi:hypothetical protein
LEDEGEQLDQQLDALAQVAGEMMLRILRQDAKLVGEFADLLLARRKRLEEQAEAAQAAPEDADAPQAIEHRHPAAIAHVVA